MVIGFDINEKDGNRHFLFSFVRIQQKPASQVIIRTVACQIERVPLKRSCSVRFLQMR